MKQELSCVSDYLSSLPDDRRRTLEQLRKVILANLNEGFEEGIQYGIIGYSVPKKLYPQGYNNNPEQPLMIAAMASRKAYLTLYLGGTFCGCGEGPDAPEPENMKWFKERWAQSGKKLSMGKACIRFKKIEDLALDVIGEAIRKLPVQELINHEEQVRKSKLDRVAARKGR
jgi:hypothetical protein